VLHLLVYIKKLPDGRRAVTSILEITGFANGEVQTSEVFAPGPNGEGVYARRFDPDGEALARLKAAGFDPDELGEPVPVETGEPQAGPRPPLPGPHPQPGPVPSHSQPPRHPGHPQPAHARPAPSPPTPPGPRPGVAPSTRRPPAPVPQGQGLPGQPPPRGVSPKRPAPVHPQQAHARQAPAAGTNGTGDRPQAEPVQGQRRPSRPGSPP
ncbi:MAG: hypothetical protein OXI12_14635, partial [Gammaproteobacteria bacterium]|nr:hypothetical protein [Gammaproteobacteria bacterium]